MASNDAESDTSAPAVTPERPATPAVAWLQRAAEDARRLAEHLGVSLHEEQQRHASEAEKAASLQKTLDEVRQRAAILEQKVAPLEEAVAGASRKREAAEAQAAEAKARLEALEKDAAVAATKLAELDEVRGRLAAVQESLDAASSDRDGARAEVASFQARLAEIDALQAAAKEHEQALGEARTQLQELQAKLEAAGREQAAAVAERDAAVMEKAAAVAARETTLAERLAAVGERDAAKAEAEGLRAKAEGGQATESALAERTRELEEARAEAKVLQDKLDAAAKDLATALSERDAAKTGHTHVVAERETWAAERQVLLAERNAARSDSASLQEQLAAAANPSASPESSREVEELKRRLAEAQEEAEDLEESRDTAESEREAAKAERDAAKAERDRIAAEHADLVKARDEALRERDRVAAEHPELVKARDEAVRDRDRAETERDRIVGETAEIRARLATLDQDLHAAKTRAEQTTRAETEVDALQARVAALDQELQAAKARVEQSERTISEGRAAAVKGEEVLAQRLLEGEEMRRQILALREKTETVEREQAAAYAARDQALEAARKAEETQATLRRDLDTAVGAARTATSDAAQSATTAAAQRAEQAASRERALAERWESSVDSFRAALAALRRTPFVPPTLRVTFDQVEPLVAPPTPGPRPAKGAQVLFLDRDALSLDALATDLEGAGIEVLVAHYPEEVGFFLKTPDSRRLATVVVDVMACRADQDLADLVRSWRQALPNLALLVSFKADNPMESERAQRVPVVLTTGYLPRPLTKDAVLDAITTAAKRQTSGRR